MNILGDKLIMKPHWYREMNSFVRLQNELLPKIFWLQLNTNILGLSDLINLFQSKMCYRTSNNYMQKSNDMHEVNSIKRIQKIDDLKLIYIVCYHRV